MEDLAELVLDSSSKKSKDDTFLEDRQKSQLVDPKSVLEEHHFSTKKSLNRRFD